MFTVCFGNSTIAMVSTYQQAFEIIEHLLGIGFDTNILSLYHKENHQ